MSLILSGTDGLSDVDGTAATPAIRGTDANTGIFFPAADTIAFAEGGAEVARFDSSGNWLLGTTSTSFSSGTTAEISGSSAATLTLSNGATPRMYLFANSSESRTASYGVTPLTYVINGTERARIDSSGNLLVGSTSTNQNIRIGQKLGVVSTGSGTYGGVGISSYSGTSAAIAPVIDINRSRGTTDQSFTAVASGDYLGYIVFRGSDGTGFTDAAYIQGAVDGTVAANQVPARLVFSTANSAGTVTERARIDSSGNLLVGLTSALGSQLGVQAAGGNGTSFTLRHTSATAGKYRLAGVDSSNNYLIYNNSNVGMYMTDGGTSWTATSDETQKILTSEFSNAAIFISTVRATRGRYKTDDESTSRSFLIAQDWQDYLPEAISEKDGILGLSYQETIPVLVKAIQELTARITALESA